MKLRQPKDSTGAALRCRSSEDIMLKGCQAKKGTYTFLKVEDSSNNADVKCTGNNLSEAAKELDVDVNVIEIGNQRI